MSQTLSKEQRRFRHWRATVEVLRYPSLALAHGVARPVLRGVGHTPAAARLFHKLGHKLELTRSKQGCFGDYQPDTRDVLVCSYGKSGTNWSLQIVHQIAHLGAGEFSHIHEVAPWPDAPAPGYAIPITNTASRDAAPTGMRAIKTHLPWRCIPHTDTAKYVCVVRDPKDMIVSGYHFFQSVMLGPLMPPVSLWMDHIMSEESFLGSWTEHLHGFWDQRHRENVLFLTFEEMKRDLPHAVDRIAALMGVPLTESQRAAVIEKSSFAYMKSIDHKFYPGLVSPLGTPHGSMMRQGESKAAGGLLIPEQRAQIDAYYKQALHKRGCDFPYGEMFEG